MGTITISMAIFHSYICWITRGYPWLQQRVAQRGADKSPVQGDIPSCDRWLWRVSGQVSHIPFGKDTKQKTFWKVSGLIRSYLNQSRWVEWCMYLSVRRDLLKDLIWWGHPANYQYCLLIPRDHWGIIANLLPQKRIFAAAQELLYTLPSITIP